VCMLQLRGYIVGRPLSVDQLVHVPSLGTFRMHAISKAPSEPCTLKPKRGRPFKA
jgi:hypothetical protein